MKSPISSVPTDVMDDEHVREIEFRCEQFILRERLAAEARERDAWETGKIVGEQIERDRAAHVRSLKLIFLPLIAAMAGLMLGALIVKLLA